ncbi:thermonuclease family protein, partial [Altererythrobacter sp. HHU K3-1]|nr:thermonuclease family protein [Actirhodobacter atriluteus]
AEMNGKCDREKRLAIRARDRLVVLLSRGPVKVHRDGFDRYGRTLARLTVDGVDVGRQLVKEGLARPYEGGRRGWC